MATLGTSAWGVTSLWFRPKYRFSWQFFFHTVRDAPGFPKPTLPPHCWHRTPSQDFSSISPLYPSFSWSFSSLPPGGRVEFYAGLSLTRRKWHKGTLENFSGRFYVCGQHIDSHTFSFQYILFIRAPNKVVGLHLWAMMSWAHLCLHTHTQTHRFYKCQTQLWAAEILE